ncbi:DUF523 domain-containing protein [Aestuariicella sp. G3-2]|uniref:DUF523 domain-containing protein n=1 Tax=Pseudomaricurvus albidus TaxID=2842452 RepID=UPI001C0B0EB3|nr:2-thiouracil desulfurase family protein [Aestuariicella albida]MBU3068529.1 DUF523 domain-containing protein [Aestuariicella albida]
MNQDGTKTLLEPALLQWLKTLSPQPPKVLISACLAGQNVRYDGREKSLGQVLTTLSAALELVQHCPEMDAGMGVPRKPIQWVQTSKGQRQLQWVEQPGVAVDFPLRERAEHWCQQQAELHAAIIKARSPSCGKDTTPLLSEQGDTVQWIDGVFVHTLAQTYPDLTIVDEHYFTREVDIVWFVVGVYLQAGKPAGLETVNLLNSDLPWQGNLEQFLDTPTQDRDRHVQTLVSRLG